MQTCYFFLKKDPTNTHTQKEENRNLEPKKIRYNYAIQSKELFVLKTIKTLMTTWETC